MTGLSLGAGAAGAVCLIVATYFFLRGKPLGTAAIFAFIGGSLLTGGVVGLTANKSATAVAHADASASHSLFGTGGLVVTLLLVLDLGWSLWHRRASRFTVVAAALAVPIGKAAAGPFASILVAAGHLVATFVPAALGALFGLISALLSGV